MRSFLRQAFVWRFAGGFALGALALVTLGPAEARHTLASRLEHATPSLR